MQIEEITIGICREVSSQVDKIKKDGKGTALSWQQIKKIGEIRSALRPILQILANTKVCGQSLDDFAPLALAALKWQDNLILDAILRRQDDRKSTK